MYLPSCVRRWLELFGPKVVPSSVDASDGTTLCRGCCFVSVFFRWVAVCLCCRCGAWLLSLFLSSTQMTHQRNLGYGFCGHRALLLLRRVVIRGSVGLHGPSNGSFQSFLPFDVPCSVSGLSAIVGCAFRGCNESQVIPGRLLCVHMLLSRTIVDDLEKRASRACLWRWADDPGGSVMGTGSPGSLCLVRAL